MGPERNGTVWSSTWVPSPSPVDGFGPEGYAVCWVDLDDGTRVQVLATGPAPEAGTPGRVGDRTFGEETISVFDGAGS